jgi:hypothetical protein
MMYLLCILLLYYLCDVHVRKDSNAATSSTLGEVTVHVTQACWILANALGY